MHVYVLFGRAKNAAKADKSAMGTINRPLLVASHFLVQVGLMYKRPFFATAITYSWHRPGMDHAAYFTFPAIEHYRPVLWEKFYCCLHSRIIASYNGIVGFSSLCNHLKSPLRMLTFYQNSHRGYGLCIIQV